LESFRALCGDAWHLSAETSLHVSEEAVRRAAGVLDYFIVDIKDTNADIYLRYTGKPNGIVLHNLEILLSLVGPERITVRVPKIPRFNTAKDIESSKQYLSQMGIVHFNFFDYIIRQPSGV